MQTQYKAIMLDIDGVVVKDAASAPSARVVDAIRKAKKKGIVVSLVTGRPLYRVIPLIQVLGIEVPVVVEGGARIYEAKTGKDIYTAYIEEDVVQRVAGIVFHKGLPANFASLQTTFSTPEYGALYRIYRAGRGEKTKGVGSEQEEVTKPEGITAPVTGIAVYAQQEYAGEVTEELKKIPSLRVSENESKSFRGWRVVTVNDQRGTKQHGVLELAKYLGIDTHACIGIGDEETDFPLLMACGLKVAMGNAVPPLKEVADYIAPSVEEDGLVDVIEKFVVRHE